MKKSALLGRLPLDSERKCMRKRGMACKVVGKWWGSGGKVVAKRWQSGGKAVAKWWQSGGKVVAK
eukprot:1801853-Pleurochrysis_carterae.AAC.1